MAKVTCSFREEDMYGDYGDVEGVIATCSVCGHETESFGTGQASFVRCLVVMREECPKGMKNFYVEEVFRMP